MQYKNSIFSAASLSVMSGSLILTVVALMICPSIAAAHFTVTSATIFGPTPIPCTSPPTKYKYTLTVTGTQWGWSGPNKFLWSIYDMDGGEVPGGDPDQGSWDSWIDDLLRDEQEAWIDPELGPNWTMTLDFQLWCDEDCEVTGKDGTSGEGTAEVYAHIEHVFTGIDILTGPIFRVTCTKAKKQPLSLWGLILLSLIQYVL